MRREQPAHRRLEDAVDRLAVEHPVAERVAEGRHAGSASAAVAADRRLEGRRRSQPGRHHVADAPGTAAASSAPRSHSVRRMFVTGRARAGSAMRSRRSRGRWTSGAGDRRLGGSAAAGSRRPARPSGAGHAPQPGRRAVRRHRPGPGGQHGGVDAPAPACGPSRAAGRRRGGARSSTPRSIARYHDRSESPAVVSGPSGDEAVVGAGERVEGAEVHDLMGVCENPERERRCDLGGLSRRRCGRDPRPGRGSLAGSGPGRPALARRR